MKRNKKQSAVAVAAGNIVAMFQPGTFQIEADTRAKLAPTFTKGGAEKIGALPQTAKAVFGRICEYLKAAGEGLYVSLVECFNLHRSDKTAFATLRETLQGLERDSNGSQRSALNVLNRAVDLIDGYEKEVGKVLSLPDAASKLSHLGVVASVVKGAKEEERAAKAKEAFASVLSGATVKEVSKLRPQKSRRNKASKSTSKTGTGESTEKRPVLFGFIIGEAVTPARVYDGTVEEIDNDLQVSGVLKGGIGYFNGTVYRRGETPVTAKGETIIVSDTGRLASRTDATKAEAKAKAKAEAKARADRRQATARIREHEARKVRESILANNAIPAGLK